MHTNAAMTSRTIHAKETAVVDAAPHPPTLFHFHVDGFIAVNAMLSNTYATSSAADAAAARAKIRMAQISQLTQRTAQRALSTEFRASRV